VEIEGDGEVDVKKLKEDEGVGKFDRVTRIGVDDGESVVRGLEGVRKDEGE